MDNEMIWEMMQYPIEHLGNDEDNGTMPDNIQSLGKAVIGHRIVSAEIGPISTENHWTSSYQGLIITLDNGTQVSLANTNDCCAFTELEEFLLHPDSVDHMILGVGTTDGYSTWHIYADFGDIMKLKVGWSCGNPFYYGYGFDIHVRELPSNEV